MDELTRFVHFMKGKSYEAAMKHKGKVYVDEMFNHLALETYDKWLEEFREMRSQKNK